VVSGNFRPSDYLNPKGDRDEAVKILKTILEKYPGYKDAEMLLGEISKK
jgi:hypothetical protein